MFSDFYTDLLSCTTALPDALKTEEIAKGLYIHLTELSEKGKLFNLTAITDRSEAVRRHAADSLHAAKVISDLARGEDKTLVDVGSGGGFPALPIAIALPNISVTALDATAKKCAFIGETASLCGVNIATVPERAEEAAASYRETFDFATARAVARLNVLLELCAPFVAVGGYFVAMKGAAADEEAEEARRAAATLGLSLEREEQYEIEGSGEGKILIYKKVSPTPEKYPRRYAQIKKKPL